ncbi:hypothetical protein TWF730_007869 [Orbilia blumenaviensis]|uniref:Uncharacterized protein n=1 Tax=Orbilia blumenaviensis TaxID=1796055 RepID=A0AAV9VFN6_9PEZI
MLLMHNASSGALASSTSPSYDLISPLWIPTQIKELCSEGLNLSMTNMNMSRLSMASKGINIDPDDSLLSNSLANLVAAHISSITNDGPEQKTTALPTEATEDQKYNESAAHYYHTKDRFLRVYGQFHRFRIFLVHLITEATGFRRAADSLHPILGLRAVYNWFSHLISAPGMVFVANDRFNDRISNFLRRNWTESLWFREFIQTIVDRKLDTDLARYFDSLDPLWDLWDDSQRTKEQNSQLLETPLALTRIHLISFLCGLLIGVILLIALVLISAVVSYCLYTLFYKCYRNNDPHPRNEHKHTVQRNYTNLGADPLEIWDKLIFDPLLVPSVNTMPQETSDLMDNRLLCWDRNEASPPETPQDANISAFRSHGDVSLPASPAGSSAPTISTAEGPAQGDGHIDIYQLPVQNTDVSNNGAFPGDSASGISGRAQNIDHLGYQGDLGTTSPLDTPPTEGIASSRGSRASLASDSFDPPDIWLTEAFTATPDINTVNNSEPDSTDTIEETMVGERSFRDSLV